MNICVIGTGYVGLVTGAVFADLGNRVVCVDKVAEKVEMLRRFEMPIYEPGLEELVSRGVQDDRLSFTTDLGSGVEQADVVFICVGTPPLPDGEPDMTYVKEAARGIAEHLNGYKVIVNKSTVPVGTGEMVREIIATQRRRDADFDVVSNPEFLREGSAIHDTLEPDRIVIGARSRDAALRIVELYAPLERPILITDVVSAEIIKYASNAFLATKISFMNAIAEICDAAGADVLQVAKGMGHDGRIGGAFLQAGLGYGGSCFPKDTRALIHTAERFECKFGILEHVVEQNDRQAERFMDRLEAALNGLGGKNVAVFGLAFKPNTDDMREAKSLEIIERLRAGGAHVRAYDPVAMNRAREVMPDIQYAANPFDAAEDADAVVIATEWNEFKQIDLERLRSVMRGDLLFDGRNICDPARVTRLGFRYYGIGRGYHAASLSGILPGAQMQTA